MAEQKRGEPKQQIRIDVDGTIHVHGEQLKEKAKPKEGAAPDTAASASETSATSSAEREQQPSPQAEEQPNKEGCTLRGCLLTLVSLFIVMGVLGIVYSVLLYLGLVYLIPVFAVLFVIIIFWMLGRS